MKKKYTELGKKIRGEYRSSIMLPNNYVWFENFSAINNTLNIKL